MWHLSHLSGIIVGVRWSDTIIRLSKLKGCVLARQRKPHKCAYSTDRYYKGDPRPRILPCVMVSSAMGLKLGVFRFLPTTHAKTNAKQTRPRSLGVVRRFTRAYLHAQTAVDASDIRTRRAHPTNHGYFDYGKKPEDPQIIWAPMSG